MTDICFITRVLRVKKFLRGRINCHNNKNTYFVKRARKNFRCFYEILYDKITASAVKFSNFQTNFREKIFVARNGFIKLALRSHKRHKHVRLCLNHGMENHGKLVLKM